MTPFLSVESENEQAKIKILPEGQEKFLMNK